MDVACVLSRLGDQKHLVRFWNELGDEQKEKLAKQVSSIDVSAAREAFEGSALTQSIDVKNLEPLPANRHAVRKDMPKQQYDKYFTRGLEAISRGEVCALVLAGGQASRLGSAAPKGTIPLGLDLSPGDSLLGLQAAKLACLERLAAHKFPGTNGKIQWVLMTSQTTEEPTREHLDKVVEPNGLSMEQVLVFSQAEIPAFDMDGNLLLKDKCTVVTAPNGNGGLYSALAPHLPSLKAKGVKYVHVYCIDNILCKVADPAMTGYMIEKEADVVTKTVLKRPGELVGSLVLDSGRVRVCEYSELGAELANKVHPDGRPVFGAGSIAIHLFHMDFLDKFATPTFHLPYHRALKKIAHVNGKGEEVKPEQPNGVKLEQFVFDVFEKSEALHIWEVERDDEFSPLKNAESAGTACMSTCRRDLAAQSRRWIEAAGGKLEAGDAWLRAARTYDGENLEELDGKVLSGKVIG